MIVNFSERKAMKNGEVTVKMVIDNLEEVHEKEGIKTIATVVRLDNDEVHILYSNTVTTEVVGLLECGKQQVINDMYEEG